MNMYTFQKLFFCYTCKTPFVTVGVPTSPTSLTVNNLLLGKSAIVSSRGRRLGPPPGAVPPSRQTTPTIQDKSEQRICKAENDTISWEEEKSRKSQNRRNSVKWKDIKKEKALDIARKASIDLDETGDGIIVSELEANAMIASMRSRSSSETSSYSSRSESSTDTSLCDENEKASDSDHDLSTDDNVKNTKNVLPKSTTCKDIPHSPQSIKKVNKDSSFEKLLSPNKRKKLKEKVDISEYLDSAAGESLRVYIDGFEMKLKEREDSSDDKKVFSAASPQKDIVHPKLQFDKKYSFLSSETEEVKNQINSKNATPSKLASYNSIKTSPCHCVLDFEPLYKGVAVRRSSTSNLDKTIRPLDIIDTMTMNPNFVPDIDLSERYESPLRSPGSDSVIISEDEPPIPLKIDKYFEHSPEFFGARLSDPNNLEIPSRRATKRNSRLPKKPDSLTLQSNNNERSLKNEVERASSLPQSHSFICIKSESPDVREKKNNVISHVCKDNKYINTQNNIKKKSEHTENINIEKSPGKDISTCKDYMLRSGRKNSERALQIIQENSQILSRILTKQNVALSNNNQQVKKNIEENISSDKRYIVDMTSPKISETKLLNSPLLKESTSDSLIGSIKRVAKDVTTDKSDIFKARPISIDDPFSFEARNSSMGSEEFSFKNIKTPSIECLGNKTDLYGWENKGFLAKCDYISSSTVRSENLCDEIKNKSTDISTTNDKQSKNRRPISDEWSRYSISSESKVSVTLPSSELKDTSTYERRFTSDDYNYPLSSSTKYNELMLTKTNDVCNRTMDQSPKLYENLVKTENSSYSDFSHRVTSSISFTCEPTLDDDSPMGAKSNSSDTLCQITSLDQISTPISPKMFPNRETPTLPRDSIDISDKAKIDSDDTCSAITSLLETDTLSSLSYPRSPSTGSYHPFPTRPAMRLPKDLGVRLGMYPKETINSPQK